MGIDAIGKLRLQQMQGIQKTQGAQSVQSHKGHESAQSSSGAASGSSLVDRLNSMDNKLNQGGGVKLNESAAGQIGGQDEMIRKHKMH